MNLINRPLLSLPMAKAMAEAAEAKAHEENLKIVVAIYDGSANLKYFLRMDDTNVGSINIAKLKAKTSANLPLSTKALAERSAGFNNDPYNHGAIPGFLLLGGGLPILTADKCHLGGIGVSGATPELDEACAQAGLDVIASALKTIEKSR